MTVHVVTITPQTVYAGTVTPKTSLTIGQAANSSSEMRVLPDASVPNSANRPSIKEYLEAEYTAGFKLVHMSNTLIITDDNVA